MAKDGSGNTYISEAQSKARTIWENNERDKTAAREARMDARAARTDEQQLAKLDRLLGKGVGAKRERERLLKRIEKRKKKAEKKAEKTEKKEQSTAAKEREASKDSD